MVCKRFGNLISFAKTIPFWHSPHAATLVMDDSGHMTMKIKCKIKGGYSSLQGYLHLKVRTHILEATRNCISKNKAKCDG